MEKHNPTIVRTHCFFIREVLGAKIAQNELKEVSEMIEIVNFIKTRPVKSRTFDLICKDYGFSTRSFATCCTLK